MALGVCPMCAAVFAADAPFKQHFLDVHGLDDDPGTETRLPDDPEPEPEPESEAEAPKKRRGWGGGRGAATFEPSKVPHVVAVTEEPPAAVETGPPPVEEIAEDPVVDIEVAHEPEAEADGLEDEDLVIVPEPVIVSFPDPDDDDEQASPSRALRLVTVAGVAFVLVVFVLAAVRLTGSDASPSAADDSGAPAAVVTAPPPAAPAAPPAVGDQYVVARGDSLSKIANRLGVSVEALVAANGIPDRNLIFPGQVLTIPR